MGTIDRHREMQPGYMRSLRKGTRTIERTWMEAIQEICSQGQDTTTVGEQLETSPTIRTDRILVQCLYTT